MRPKVLIAEDDSVGRRVLELFVKPFADCTLAKDGQEALAYFVEALQARVPYNIIILDIGMPVMDGLQALRQIRDFEAENGTAAATPVILLTGQTEAAMVKAAEDLGIAAYLFKPVEELQLIGALRQLGLVSATGGGWDVQ